MLLESYIISLYRVRQLTDMCRYVQVCEVRKASWIMTDSCLNCCTTAIICVTFTATYIRIILVRACLTWSDTNWTLLHSFILPLTSENQAFWSHQPRMDSLQANLNVKFGIFGSGIEAIVERAIEIAKIEELASLRSKVSDSATSNRARNKIFKLRGDLLALICCCWWPDESRKTGTSASWW